MWISNLKLKSRQFIPQQNEFFVRYVQVCFSSNFNLRLFLLWKENPIGIAVRPVATHGRHLLQDCVLFSVYFLIFDLSSFGFWCLVHCPGQSFVVGQNGASGEGCGLECATDVSNGTWVVFDLVQLKLDGHGSKMWNLICFVNSGLLDSLQFKSWMSIVFLGPKWRCWFSWSECL